MNKITGGIILLMLMGTAHGITISCPECYVGNCRCTSDCPHGAGSLDVFETRCEGSPLYGFTISSSEVKWSPPKEGTYYLKVLCDEGGKSDCVSVKVKSPPTTTISTSTTSVRPTTNTTTILVCNNNTICESDRKENYINCPLDCPSGGQDNYCDGIEDGRCDPDCAVEEDTDCGRTYTPQNTDYTLYVVLFIIALCIILFLVYKRLEGKK